MFEYDSKQSYMMPTHFGPRYVGAKTSGWYHDVTMMVVSYRTDRAKLTAHLPPPYELGEEAIVSVVYACNKQVDWLAGHGYNLISVNVPVFYNGERDQLEGSFTLVMWENLADPILSGRELQGIPKIYADIPEHSIVAEEWRSNASHFGHKIVDLSIANLRPATAEELETDRKANAGKDNPMGLRYLPAVGGYGQPITEATTFPSESIYTEALVGEGKIDWNQLSWEQNPTQFHIVNALASLPVIDYLPAVVTKGSTNLIVPERPSRSLR